MSQNGLIITTLSDGTVEVSGRDTFTHRITLKSLGGTWNAESKAWILPAGFSITDLGISTPAPQPSPVPTRRIPGHGTFAVKDEIKKAGGRWDPDTKEWIVPVSFDDSIIPKVEKKEAPPAEHVPRPRAPPHCGICRSPNHKRDKCDYVCTACGKIGKHLSGRCTPPGNDSLSAGW